MLRTRAARPPPDRNFQPRQPYHRREDGDRSARPHSYGSHLSHNSHPNYNYNYNRDYTRDYSNRDYNYSNRDYNYNSRDTRDYTTRDYNRDYYNYNTRENRDYDSHNSHPNYNYNRDYTRDYSNRDYNYSNRDYNYNSRDTRDYTTRDYNYPRDGRDNRDREYERAERDKADRDYDRRYTRDRPGPYDRRPRPEPPEPRRNSGPLRRNQPAQTQHPPQTQQHPPPHQNKPHRTKIFIGNLSGEVSQEELTTKFSSFGPINRVDFRRKFAFVDFVRAKDADAAIRETHGKFLWGSCLKVQPHVEQSKKLSARDPKPPFQITVTNLDESVSWQDLKDFARQAGDVSYASVIIKGDRRFGLIEFTSDESVQNAMRDLNGKSIVANRLELTHMPVSEFLKNLGFNDDDTNTLSTTLQSNRYENDTFEAENSRAPSPEYKDDSLYQGNLDSVDYN